MLSKKKSSIILIGILISIASFAQEQPVKWNFFAKKIADKQYELHLIATIKSGWHIYSSNQPKTSIGLPTSIKVTNNPLLNFPGKLREKGTLHKVKNEELGTIEYQYSEEVDFVRLVNVKVNAKTNITGSIEFMACTDERCLPPETVTFRLPLQ
jgi:hypothetical protein